MSRFADAAVMSFLRLPTALVFVSGSRSPSGYRSQGHGVFDRAGLMSRRNGGGRPPRLTSTTTVTMAPALGHQVADASPSSAIR